MYIHYTENFLQCPDLNKRYYIVVHVSFTKDELFFTLSAESSSSKYAKIPAAIIAKEFVNNKMIFHIIQQYIVGR